MNTDTKIRRASHFTTSAFQVIGTLSIFVGLVFLWLFLVNTEARKHGGRDLSHAIFFAIYLIPIGIGVLFLRRLFAVLIALPCLALALKFGVDMILEAAPFPAMLIGVAVVFVLCIPASLTVKAWKELK